MLSAVCIQSCRPNSKSNRYFFSFPTAAFFFLELIWILQMERSVFSAKERNLPRRTKTQTGRHFLTSQVIRNSSKTLTNTRARALEEGIPTGTINHTHPSTWLWSEVDHQHNMQSLSVRFAATSITWSLAKPNMRIQSTIKLGFVFELNKALFPVSAARRWVLRSGWVCWVTRMPLELAAP